MNYTVFAFYDKKRIPELMELFSTGLGETSTAHWEWRLFSNIGEMNPIAVVCENKQGRLDGMMTAIPVSYGKGKVKVLQMCDWVVRPEARGRGLISMMYRYITDEYQKRNYDGVSAFANENSKPVFVKYQYRDYGTFCSWSTMFHFFFKKDTTEDVVKGNIRYSFSKSCPNFDVPIRDNRLFRDRPYLVWKYDRNPETEYTWLSIWKEDVYIGYMVYTLTKGRIRTVANIYDWEFDERYEAEFAMAIKLIHKRGNSVCIWGKYSNREERLFLAAGMRKTEIGTPLSIKAYPNKSVPNDLVFTRVDTDF